MSYLRIINWERHQHYKDRNPPWIKLHRELLTSETWVTATNDDRALVVAIMLLAAATGNRVPANPRYIQRVAYLDHLPSFDALVATNFIEIIEENDAASNVLADARPETENRDREDTLEPDGSNGADAPQGPSAIELKAAVFAAGVPLLTSNGSTDRNARSMLGRWRQSFGDGAVLDALSAATAEGPSDPIPWITRTLERRNGQHRPANGDAEPQNTMLRAALRAEAG